MSYSSRNTSPLSPHWSLPSSLLRGNWPWLGKHLKDQKLLICIVLQHIPRARLEIITDGLLITSGCSQCIGNRKIQSLISDIAYFNIFDHCVTRVLKCFPDLRREQVISLFWFSIQLTWKISHHVRVDLLSDLNALVWFIPSLFLKFGLFLQVHQLSSCVPHQHLERR